MNAIFSRCVVGAPGRRSAISTVCVVDRREDDYQGWRSLAESRGVRLEIVSNANDALRIARRKEVDLWVINTNLLQLSGHHLCSMLKNQRRHAAIYLVADEYSADAERAAWGARATLFGCKGAHHDWLADWLEGVYTRGPLSTHHQISYAAMPQHPSANLD